MSVIAAVRGELPEHRYTQAEVTEALLALPGFSEHADFDPRRAPECEGRQPPHGAPAGGLQRAHDFVRQTTCSSSTQSNSGVPRSSARSRMRAWNRPTSTCIMTTTVTGLAVPTRGRADRRPDRSATRLRRVPMFGLGCVAGAAGIARLHDYLRGAPDGVAVLLAVEMCSLTPEDRPVDGDTGGQCTVRRRRRGGGRGGRSHAPRRSGRRGPRCSTHEATCIRTRCARWDGTWARPASGWCSRRTCRRWSSSYLADDVTEFLASHDLTVDDIGAWVSHPGGPKVIEAITETLGLPDDALELTWRSLAEVGNLSSASVLHVLRDTMAKRPPAGSPGVLMAMGPGFCSELVLLRWR